MPDKDTSAVLRCGRCNKPFDKQSTLKRHGYYCRSRTGGTTIRLRSCISCAKRKARCDQRQPECSKCITKGIECHYPANTPKGTTRSEIRRGSDVTTEPRKMSPSMVPDSTSVENRQEASKDSDMFLNDALAMSILDPEFVNLGEEFFDWDASKINFADLLNPRTNHETLQVQQFIPSPNVSIPAIPSSNTRSLIPRPKVKTGAQRIANLIFRTLKSYPLMMLRRNTLPPFIHPSLISSDVEKSRMESLNNCISLVHMISGEVPGSRKLFWKNVRMECERLYEEHLKLNKWELLAAMQALSVYIIIRLDEGETDYNDFDFLLLATVAVIAKQANYVGVTTKISPQDYGLETS